MPIELLADLQDQQPDFIRNPAGLWVPEHMGIVDPFEKEAVERRVREIKAALALDRTPFMLPPELTNPKAYMEIVEFIEAHSLLINYEGCGYMTKAESKVFKENIEQWAQERIKAIKKLFTDLGLPVIEHKFKDTHQKQFVDYDVNLEIPIINNPNAPYVYVVAHHDHKWGKGACDDASGVAMGYRIAEYIRNIPLPVNVIILIVDGEEDRLYGSNKYCKNLSPEQKENTIGAWAFECLGDQETPELAIFKTKSGISADPFLLAEAEIARQELIKQGFNIPLIIDLIHNAEWYDDSNAFLQSKMPGIAISGFDKAAYNKALTQEKAAHRAGKRFSRLRAYKKESGLSIHSYEDTSAHMNGANMPMAAALFLFWLTKIICQTPFRKYRKIMSPPHELITTPTREQIQAIMNNILDAQTLKT